MLQTLRRSRFVPALAGLPLSLLGALLLSLGLAACASKNPLIDEPTSPVSAATPAATPATTPTAAPTAAPATAAAPAQQGEAASASAVGVQTTRESRFLGFLTPYRPDIQQGNFVSREMLSQLKEGMTPEQVRFVLGTPLLADAFHADRWDYVFRLKRGNGEVTSSRVSVFFKDNRLVRHEGGDLPTEAEYLARIAGAIPLPKDNVLRPSQSAPASSGAQPEPAVPSPVNPSIRLPR